MGKNEVLPHALCGAMARRTGKSCRQPAMKNGRCRLHGGLSTGPKTQKGKDKIMMSNTRHGFYAKKSVVDRKYIDFILRKGKNFLDNF